MMKSFCKSFILVILQIIWQLRLVATSRISELPNNPCPEYFEYQRYNDRYFGVLKIPDISLGTTNLDVQFSHTRPNEMSTILGRISPIDDQQTIISNIKNGLPISYHVDFPNPQNPPKLQRIIVNDAAICSDVGASFQLQHSLMIIETSSDCIQSPTLLPPNQTSLPRPSTSDSNRPVNKISNNSNLQNSQISCGRADPRAFVQGGSKLSRGQIPWIVAIFRTSATDLRFHCTGSLLSSSTVITVAHCFNNLKRSTDVVVQIGAHNFTDYTESSRVIRKAIKIIVHPEYEENNFINEIAILHLDSPVSFNQYVSPVCLWNESADLNEIAGLVGFVSGWGQDEKKQVTTPNNVDAVIGSYEECSRSRVGELVGLMNGAGFCAGNRDGTGPCIGDSGSGLVLNRNGRWTLRGLVNIAIIKDGTCDLTDFIGYTDVAKYMKWIQENLVPM